MFDKDSNETYHINNEFLNFCSFMGNKVDNISYALLFLGIGVLTLIQSYWPSLILVAGIFFCSRAFLVKKYFRFFCFLLLFSGGYLCVLFPDKFSWNYVLPVLFFTLALEKIFRLFIKNSPKRTKRVQSSGSSTRRKPIRPLPSSLR